MRWHSSRLRMPTASCRVSPFRMPGADSPAPSWRAPSCWCDGKLSYNQARDEQSLHLEQVRTYSDLTDYQAKERPTVQRSPASPAPDGWGDELPDTSEPVGPVAETVVVNDSPSKPAVPLPEITDVQGGPESRPGIGESDEVLRAPEPTAREITATAPPAELDRRDSAELSADVPAAGCVALHLRLDEGKPADAQVAAVQKLNDTLTAASGPNRWTVELIVSVNGLSTGFRYPEPMPLDPENGNLPHQLEELGVKLWVERRNQAANRV